MSPASWKTSRVCRLLVVMAFGNSSLLLRMLMLSFPLFTTQIRMNQSHGAICARLSWSLIGFHPFNKKLNVCPAMGTRAWTLWIDMDAYAACFSHHLFNYSLRPATPPGLSGECQRYGCRGRPGYCRITVASHSLEEERDTTSCIQLTEIHINWIVRSKINSPSCPVHFWGIS